MFVGLFRNQQHEHQAHRFAIRSVELDRRLEAEESSHRVLQALYPAVRDCDALTEAGRASRSRANRLSNTVLRAIPWLFSKSRPACSKTRFLLLASGRQRHCWREVGRSGSSAGCETAPFGKAPHVLTFGFGSRVFAGRENARIYTKPGPEV